MNIRKELHTLRQVAILAGCEQEFHAEIQRLARSEAVVKAKQSTRRVPRV